MTADGSRPVTSQDNTRARNGVEVGQVWADNDYRSGGRTITVLEIVGERARVRSESKTYRGHPVSRETWVKLSRFRPNSTGYRFLRSGGVPRDC